MTNSTIIITRHTGLVSWLNQHGITGKVIAQATPDDVRGKDVVGVLPLNLACLANKITTVDFNCPADLRGVDLTAQQLDDLGTKLSTFVVSKIS